MRLNVCKEFTFAAAHSLPNYKGPCANLHGHEWKLEVEVSGEVEEKSGMVLDFVQLKKVVNSAIIERMDHSHVNEMYENPTAENMVTDFVRILQEQCGDYRFPITLERIRLYETPTSFCEWRRQDNAHGVY